MAMMTWPLTSDGAGAVQYTANDWRTIVTALFTEGILGASSFAVSERAAGANMQLDIAAGVAVIEGDDAAGQGRYLVRDDAADTEAVTIGTADPSNPRIDLVGIQLKDPSEGGAAGRESVFAVVAGTAASSPSTPAVPDSFLLLATVLVPAGATSIDDVDITDSRILATLAHDVVDDANGTRLGTFAATANELVRRNSNGRARFATPFDTDDAANKGYVDAAIATAVATSDTPTSGTLASGTIRYAKVAGIVHVVTTSAGWNMASATLPAGFRPAVAVGVDVHSLASGSGDPISNVVTISTGGVLSASLSASATWFSFSFVAA